MKKDRILEYLSHGYRGRENEISGRELCKRFHLSKSDLHKLVNRLRREGEPICSDQGGYFYAKDASEVCSTADSLDKMIAGMMAAKQGLLGSLVTFSQRGG